MIGSGSTLGSSTMSLINPNICIVITNSTALITSFAFLITNEFISKLKRRYPKLWNSIKVITLLLEITWKVFMVDKQNWWKRSTRIEKKIIFITLIK